MATKKKEIPAFPPAADEEIKVGTLEDYLRERSIVARYLEAHGRWVDGYVNAYHGKYATREFLFCECAICADARVLLGV